MSRGRIIEIEGTDGSGKQTQANLLADNLKRLGIDAIVVSFPDYESVSSKPVRDFLNGDFGGRDLLTPIEISMLYAFDRSVAFRNMKLQEKLDNGTWLIIDRYIGSNIIHNTVDLAGKKLVETIINMEDLEYSILKLPKADEVFYLYVPRSISRILIDNRGCDKDINELDDEYLSKVERHGLYLAKELDWTIIDCIMRSEPLCIKHKDIIARDLFTFVCSKYLNMKI